MQLQISRPRPDRFQTMTSSLQFLGIGPERSLLRLETIQRCGFIRNQTTVSYWSDIGSLCRSVVVRWFGMHKSLYGYERSGQPLTNNVRSTPDSRHPNRHFRFSPDLVRFTPESGPMARASAESVRDPTRTFAAKQPSKRASFHYPSFRSDSLPPSRPEHRRQSNKPPCSPRGAPWRRPWPNSYNSRPNNGKSPGHFCRPRP